jgi:hypothetical protein
MTTKVKETAEHISWRGMIERCENPYSLPLVRHPKRTRFNLYSVLENQGSVKS